MRRGAGGSSAVGALRGGCACLNGDHALHRLPGEHGQAARLQLLHQAARLDGAVRRFVAVPAGRGAQGEKRARASDAGAGNAAAATHVGTTSSSAAARPASSSSAHATELLIGPCIFRRTGGATRGSGGRGSRAARPLRRYAARGRAPHGLGAPAKCLAAGRPIMPYEDGKPSRSKAVSQATEGDAADGELAARRGGASSLLPHLRAAPRFRAPQSAARRARGRGAWPGASACGARHAKMLLHAC